jgi:hypothetical protein
MEIVIVTMVAATIVIFNIDFSSHATKFYFGIIEYCYLLTGVDTMTIKDLGR